MYFDTRYIDSEIHYVRSDSESVIEKTWIPAPCIEYRLVNRENWIGELLDNDDDIVS